jgi:hypothetical protein
VLPLERPKKALGRNWRVVFIVAAIAICAIYVALQPLMVAGFRQYWLFGEAFRAYASALTHEDYPRAYELSGPEFRAVTPYQDFVSQQAGLRPAFGRLKSVEQGRTEVHGHGSPMRWVAVSHVEFKYEKRAVSFVYTFQKTEGRWLLFGYRQTP